MKNKDIEARLIKMYINGWITKEELDRKLDKLDKKDKPVIKEPPTIY